MLPPSEASSLGGAPRALRRHRLLHRGEGRAHGPQVLVHLDQLLADLREYAKGLELLVQAGERALEVAEGIWDESGHMGSCGRGLPSDCWSCRTSRATRSRLQPSMSRISAIITSTLPIPSPHSQPGTSRLRSRCISWESDTSARSKRGGAAIPAAGMAGSAGRYTGTSASVLPFWILMSAFQLPATGSGSVVR